MGTYRITLTFVLQLLAVCQLVASIKTAGAVPAPTSATGPAGQAPAAAAAAAWRAAVTNVRSSDDVVFSSGTIPTDSTGQPVAAHEGWLLLNVDTYLWYGSSQKQNVTDGTHWDWLSDGVRLYTSHDLSSWKLRATVFTAADIPAAVRQRLQGSSNAPLRLERPKVLYNAAHRYYVLMFSVGSLDRSRAEVGWAVSVSPYGPFKFDSTRQPDGLPSWDLTVASEQDTDAWMARTVPGTGIVISKLSEDFLDTAGRCAVMPATKPTRQHSISHPMWPHIHGPHATKSRSTHSSVASATLLWGKAQGPAAAAATQQGLQRLSRLQQQHSEAAALQAALQTVSSTHLDGTTAATHAAPHVPGSTRLQGRRREFIAGPEGSGAVFDASHEAPHVSGSASLQGRRREFIVRPRGPGAVFGAKSSTAKSSGAISSGAKSHDAGAPCLFKFRGKWYLLAAQQTGWSPTKAVLYVNDGSSPCAASSWRQLPSPAQGPGAAHIFESTPAFVYAHTFEGSDQVVLVYFGDRWNPSQPAGPANASYVWLPLVPQSGPGAQPDSLQLLNLNSWRLGDFRPPTKLQSS